MAHISRLVDWTLKNSAKLSLNVTKLGWISNWLPGHFDYQVAITYKNGIYRGRGIDTEEPVAFGKAVAEAFERFAMTGFDNPWATAAYLDHEGAAVRAYYELVGIDRALCHHYSKTRFIKLDLSIFPEQFQLNHLKKTLEKNNLEVGLFELRSVTDAKVCTMMAWHKNPAYKIRGFVNGYGCASDINSAVKSAVYECLRTAAAVYLGGARPDQPLETLNQPGSSWFHFWATQTAECMDYFKTTLLPDENSTQQLTTEALSIKDVSIEKIFTLEHAFPGIPLVIAQAKSDKFIKPQFGPFRPDAATIKRLTEFCGHPVKLDVVAPHFYG